MRSDRSYLSSAGVRFAVIGATTVALGVLAAACSSGSSGSGAGRPTTLQAAALQYAVCMRAQGVPDFPDPNSRAEISLSDQPGSDVNPSSPAFQAAQRSCARVEGQNPKFPTPAQRAQFAARLLQFARCVRAHGSSNFPDPSSLGPNQGLGFLINGNTLDPHSPALQTAIGVCERVVMVNPAFASYG